MFGPAAPATLRTARLWLRPPAPEDAAAVVAGIGNYDVARWLGRVPFPYAPEDAAAFLSEVAEQSGKHWFIHDDGGLVGGISIDGELGYWLIRDAWGKGYATEAGDAVIDVHFADRYAESLPSGHFLDNKRSARVLTKLGFVGWGIRQVASVALRQDVASRQMLLTREDWQARRRYRLSTRRLRLRELRATDVSAVARIAGDPRVAPMLGSVPSPMPLSAAAQWVAAAAFRGRPGFHAAITSRGGRFLGTVGLLKTLDGTFSCNLFLDPRGWGRGLATEAASAFLADVMKRFDIDALWARRFADDPASARVIEKLGFQRANRGSGTSDAWLEAAPVVIYRLGRSELKAVS